VAIGLCRHPKTPPAIAMQMIHRLTERDLKLLSTDRNVTEALRGVARKLMTKSRA
jgi:ABC-type lipopolysaccharide export system ATPase subunit